MDKIKENLDKVNKEIRCGRGNHNWVAFGDVKWCKFCGTLLTKTYGKDDSEMLAIIPKIHYPESPHYLPKENKNETTKET